MSSMQSSVSENAPLKGSTVPRLWTRPLRKLTPETSLGFEAIEFAERALGRTLHPWQKWFLVHSMELSPGSFVSDDVPQFRFETVLLLVARQNGKSYIMSTRLLWRMVAWDGPEEEPTLVLGTAHKLSLAEEILDLSHTALKNSPIRARLAQKSNTNGNKFIKLTNGARYKCEAASDDGGRGLSVTDLAFDELRQQREWSAWSAMTNTTNAITSSQTIAVSNAGEAKSEVLRSLRAKGIEEIQAWEAAQAKGTEYSPADPSLALFEYSAPDDCDIFDRKAWAMANPSLGYPHGPSEETLAARAALVGKPGEGMPEHKFRTENLCQWVNVAEDSLFKEEDLIECLDPDSEPAQDSPIYISVDVAEGRRMSTISLASWRDDGLPHVEVMAQRPNTEWIPGFLAEKLLFEPAAVIVQGRGAPASSLIDYIEAAGTPVLKCEGTALTNAYAQFYDRVINHSVRWRDQPALTLALAEIQVKSMGDTFVFNRVKSPVDIAPACAAAFALWGLTSQKAPEKKTSAYAGDYEDWYTADQIEDGGKWW